MTTPAPAIPEAREAEVMAGLLPPVPPRAPLRAGWRGYFSRLVTFSHCRVELPWFRFAGRTDRVALLHRLALVLDPDGPRSVGVAGKIVAGLLHGLNAVTQSVNYFRQYAYYVAPTYRIGRWRLFRESWGCLVRNNQMPRHYYERRLFAEPDPARWLEQLEHRHLTMLLDAINVRLPVHRLTNKQLFAEHGRAHGLPVVPSLAAWNGHGREILPLGALPVVDLVAKPFADYGGAGVTLLMHDHARSGHVLGGATLAPEALGRALAARAQGRGCLLQERLRNAAATASWFGHDDIANVRLVTGLYPGGAPQLLAAGLRVPSRFTTWGHERKVLLASVSLAGGRLGAAYERGICAQGYTHHPDTGALLAGAVLPRWSEMIQLALAAHATCPWLPFVGWDVVDSDRGLRLLEANAYWGANVVQMPGATPLGATEFPAMYLAWHRALGLPGLPGGAGEGISVGR